ncbi:hypothetical protein AMATHDRAFT_146767 [Amanita thiersii Skay4041]|uniref:WD repeat-containing protein 75 second beta-propeller domain-containing protein n=1 Tax=Amanita thiersii Skay4041 TaxID=703135 RepID=A0A2A9NNG0_9AGAR|nr:hypothetical protein AMATHDRAFT_146767 [Amanita thiersii Skay4041]
MPKKRQVATPKLPPQSKSAWDWASLTDPSASRVPPIYTKDGRHVATDVICLYATYQYYSYFFSLVGPSVKIYSVTTGQVVSTLTAPRLSSQVDEFHVLTSAVLNPCNAFQLITGSLDGRLLIWDFLDATLLQTVDLAQPIHCICAHEKFKDSVFVAASKTGKQKINDNAIVLQVSLRTDADDNSKPRKSPVILAIGKTRFPTGLAFSPTGTWLVATAGHKVYVAQSASFKAGFVKYVSPEHLTCLAFHPFDDYFATGDKKGVVRLWYCLNENIAVNIRDVEKRTQTMSLHWHAHAVTSIAFTTNGAYLLSGGEEAVLVIWQLHTGTKEFVPRLGAPISTVSVSKASGDEEYLVGLADATYCFVRQETLRISRSYAGIKLDPTPLYGPVIPKVFSPIAVHEKTSTLILPSSHPSSLQIYSPSSSKLLYDLEISPTNRVSRRDEKPIDPPRVEKVAVSPCNRWMATIDAREKDDSFHGETYLKIWEWDHKTGFWILNTRIDRPHGLARVTSLAFSPSPSLSRNVYLASTGDDGAVKIWGIRTVKDKSGQTEEYWVTRSTFNLRSELPSAVSWSSDASLLAVSLGPYVAVYDPNLSGIRQLINSPECPATTGVQFIGRGGRYLAIVGQQDVVLWDLVVQSARWHYRIPNPIQQLIPHPQGDSFVVFHCPSTSEVKRTVALTFNVKSSLPVNEQSIPYVFRSIVHYAQSARMCKFCFVGVTTSWGVVSFGEDILQVTQEGSHGNKIATNATPLKRSLFHDIFGESAFTHLPEERPTLQSISSSGAGRLGSTLGIFDGPSHTLPPISVVFDDIMEGFLQTQPRDTERPTVVEEDEDVDMEGEPPEVVTLESQRLQTRRIDQEEVNSLVSLFKTQIIGRKLVYFLYDFDFKIQSYA